MPPGVAVSPGSMSSGYAACSLINVDRQRIQQQVLGENFSENMDAHIGISGSSSRSSSSSSYSASSSASSVESAELSDKDQFQVQSCYKGLKTQVTFLQLIIFPFIIKFDNACFFFQQK